MMSDTSFVRLADGQGNESFSTDFQRMDRSDTTMMRVQDQSNAFDRRGTQMTNVTDTSFERLGTDVVRDTEFQNAFEDNQASKVNNNQQRRGTHN